MAQSENGFSGEINRGEFLLFIYHCTRLIMYSNRVESVNHLDENGRQIEYEKILDEIRSL